MVIDDVHTEKVLNSGLEQQITNAIDSRFLLQLVCSHNFHSSDYGSLLVNQGFIHLNDE